jgi:hypothetical protein
MEESQRELNEEFCATETLKFLFEVAQAKIVMQMWPDLPIGIITLIDAELDVHDIGFKPSLIWPPQLLHYCSIGYQPCTTGLTSLRRLCCRRIMNTSKNTG